MKQSTLRIQLFSGACVNGSHFSFIQYLHKQVWRLKGADFLMSSSGVPKCDFKNKSECVINWLPLIQSFALSDFEIT